MLFVALLAVIYGEAGCFYSSAGELFMSHYTSRTKTRTSTPITEEMAIEIVVSVDDSVEIRSIFAFVS
jgi:hypothetical protein